MKKSKRSSKNTIRNGRVNSENELWRDVVGLEKYYRVSNKGRIFSIPRVVKTKRHTQKIDGRILKPNGKVYLKVHLSVNGVSHHKQIHRLVAEAFIPNPDNLPAINHKNGKKHDNHVENLEWCTYSNNTLHAYVTGLMKANPRHGEECHFSKLKVKDVIKMRSEVNKTYGRMIKKLMEEFRVSKSTVRAVIDGSSWKKVKI